MNDSWTCVSVDKGPGILPEDVRVALMSAACRLYATKTDMMRIEDDLVSGVIKTDWKTHMVGTRSGVLFHAQVDCETGNDYGVNFLYHEDDLVRGTELIDDEQYRGELEASAIKETSGLPPELYRFSDLRGPSRRVH